MSLRLTGRVLVLAFLLEAPGAAAHPWDAFGADSRGAGMGGALATLADNGFAAFYNPAALTLSSAATLTIGYVGSVAVLRGMLDDAGSLPYPEMARAGIVSAADVGNHSSLMVAGTLPFNRIFPVLRREITLGVALGIPLGASIVDKASAPAPEDPFVVGGRSQRTMVMLGLGGEILPEKLAIGMGMLALVDVRANASIGAPLQPEGAGGAGAAGTGAVSQRFETDVALSAGALWRIAPWFSLAVTFRNEQTLETELDVDVTTAVDPAGAVVLTVPYTLRSTMFFVPRQLLLGLSARPHQRLVIALEGAYLQSSALQEASPIARLAVHSDAVDDGGLLRIPASDGTRYRVPPAPAAAVSARDVFVLRAGVEVEAVRDLLQVRAGYTWIPRYLDGDQGSLLLDADRHVTGVGFTLALGSKRSGAPGMRITGHFQLIVLANGTHGVSLPGAGGPEGHGTATLDGYHVGGGLTTTFQY